jgi:phosphoglycolate phosphatase
VFDHVLCDFDGTLVDSSDGILETLRSCLSSVGKRSTVELTRQLIGPPLRTLIEVVAASSDVNARTEIEMAFRREYDERGYLATRPYPGIAEALTELRAHGVHLHIVTNKRLLPTLRILEMLGWSDVFSTVNTLDSGSAGTTKTQVVAHLLSQLRVRASSVALVGDSLDDAIAARNNSICYAWATWGYGREVDLGTTGARLVDARQLIQLVLQKDVVEVAHGA